MSDGSIEITAGSGVELYCEDTTIGGTTKKRQYMLKATPARGSYTAIASNVDIATANDHQLVVMGDSSSYGQITRITIEQSGAAAADDTIEFDVYRVTTAGTGGASITCRDLVGGSAYGGSAFSQPTSKGTESDKLLEFRVPVTDTEPLTANGPYVWEPSEYMSPIVFGSATTNGIAVKNIDNDASADVTITIEFILTSFTDA